MGASESSSSSASSSSSSSSSERSLEYAPTWALATVAAAFIIISLTVERLLHFLGNYLHRSKQKALYAALLKMKDELMLLGFISLTLAILRDPVSKICIRSSLYDKWTPCKISDQSNVTSTSNSSAVIAGQKLSTSRSWKPSDDGAAPFPHGRRLLAEATTSYTCPQGQEPFLTKTDLEQLHILIFILAVVHVVYSCLTMVLALLKVYSWGKWEKEAHDAVSQHTMQALLRTITYSRQSTFVRRHTSRPWSHSGCIMWVVCFLQQFYVPRADYLALRLSFVTKHQLPDNYHFHAYMVRCMEDEFQTIVGISIWLWGFVIVFLVMNVDGSNLYFYTSFVPVVAVLVIGTKLQHVVATMALEKRGVHGPYIGVLLKPRDQLFWFNQPKWLLYLLHLILFESAFEVATFFWDIVSLLKDGKPHWEKEWQFGIHTCLLENKKAYTIIRLVLGLGVQLLCSFSLLPLFALVSQMGSNYNAKAIFYPRVLHGIRAWHKRAKQRLKLTALIEAESARYKRPIVVKANYLWGKKQVSSRSPWGVATPGRSPHQLEITLPPMAATMEDGSLVSTSESSDWTVTLSNVPGGQAKNVPQIMAQILNSEEGEYSRSQSGSGSTSMRGEFVSDYEDSVSTPTMIEYSFQIVNSAKNQQLEQASSTNSGEALSPENSNEHQSSTPQGPLI